MAEKKDRIEPLVKTLPTDPRKAYYARYLEPAISAIEQQNIAEATVERIKGRMERLSALTGSTPSKKETTATTSTPTQKPYSKDFSVDK